MAVKTECLCVFDCVQLYCYYAGSLTFLFYVFAKNVTKAPLIRSTMGNIQQPIFVDLRISRDGTFWESFSRELSNTAGS